MLFEKIRSISPDKVAIIADGKSFTYGRIQEEAAIRSSFFENRKDNFLLCHTSDLENLFNFLAIIYAGGRAVFGGKNLNLELKNNLSVIHNLTIVDYIPEPTSQIGKLHKPTKNEYFLGVLSSGSTGQSKLIWKDYQAWFSAFPHQSDVFGISQNDNIFILDALAYSANLNAVLHGLWLGATVVLGKLSEASAWVNHFKSHAVTSAFLVPSHLRLLVNNLQFEDLVLKSLVTAGEKLDAKLAQKVIDTIPEILLTEYYGAAELGHVSFAQNQDIVEHPTTVGRAFPDVKIEIKQDKIFVESPYVSPEYRNISTVFDLGFLDADGRLCVFGRQGRMFNRRGLNIYAEEIENAALLHPFVNEAVLIKNPIKSDTLELLVVVYKEVTKSELQSFLLKKITKDKLPNRIVFANSIPRNEAGKVDFRVLAKKPIEEDILVK